MLNLRQISIAYRLMLTSWKAGSLSFIQRPENWILLGRTGRWIHKRINCTWRWWIYRRKSSGYQSWIQYLTSEEIRSGQIGTDPTYRYSGSARSNQTYSGFPVMVDQIRYQPGNSHPWWTDWKDNFHERFSECYPFRTYRGHRYVCTDWNLVKGYHFRYKDTHPECVIESDIDCPDASIEIPEIITISLIRILCECLDNVYKHANANRIDINIQILSDQISVHINDNGIGIDKNYSHTSPWNSGLHRIQELIYLLNGQLKIDGDIISGTDIRFSIPIEIM